MPMLELRELDVAYGDAQALFGVSLKVEQGQIVTLIGANGSGKSTTLRTISGLMQPRRGEILFEGQPLQRIPAHRRVELGLVHVPEARRVFPGMTVQENLVMGAFHAKARPHTNERMKQAFEMFPRLAERRQQLAGTLSGGEQQMLAIGRALMSGPRLLMLDEPSLGLAPNIVAQILGIITRIREEQGITILLVEQNAQAALKVANQGFVLEHGRVVLQGSGQSLLDDTHVRQAYLGL